ncbi:hypothetical protein [Escherichia coli]|nr:hypothetical protein [Escherichia coli]WCE58479.1 hypothetical protein PL330_01365 [Escherichia coli]
MPKQKMDFDASAGYMTAFHRGHPHSGAVFLAGVSEAVADLSRFEKGD